MTSYFGYSFKLARLELYGSIALSFFRNCWLIAYFFLITSNLYFSLFSLLLTSSSLISSVVLPEWGII